MLRSIGILSRNIAVLYAKGRHAPFLCPRAQINGGPGQPNWYKQEYKKAKSEGRAADYRWGSQVTHDDVDGPDSKDQPPQEVPQPQCAAAAMMHGMAPASSLHGGCPPIQDNQPYGFPGAFPGMVPMQRDVITPKPGLSNSSESMGSQHSILCSDAEPLVDVHSSLQHHAESPLSIVWQTRSSPASRVHHGSESQHSIH